MKRETDEKGVIRSSWFEVPKISNVGPQTLTRLACLVRRSCRSQCPYKMLINDSIHAFASMSIYHRH